MKYIYLLLALFSAPLLAAEKPLNVSTSGGRYQLIRLGEARVDTFLLDTQTGKMWQPSCEMPVENSPYQCQYNVFWPIDAIGINASYQDVIKRVDAIKKAMKEKDETK